MRILFYNIVLFVFFIPSLLTAQEVPGAFNFTASQIQNARTDGKPDKNTANEVTRNDEIAKLENMILELRKSVNPNLTAINNLQNRISVITKQSVTMSASYYPGQVTPSTLFEQFDAIGNTLILSKNNMKCIATVTEYTGATAGRIWAIAGFQGLGSGTTPDSLRVLYSSNNGNSWIPYANITLGGTDKINYGDIDAELIEGGTNKYLHIVYGLRASGGTGKWFAGGASIQLTGTFNGNVWAFYWPGDDATKRYYCPKITSDNFIWPSAPWVYVAVSFDSAGASGRVNTQKYAQLNSPNTVNPVFNYKANKIYWYSETATQQNLYTDIAFFQRGFIDSLVISYCGVADSTKAFFSKMSASGGLISPVNPGQYIGPIGGSEPNFMKFGGRLSSNGNSNGSIFFIFNQKSATTDGVKYFRTTNYGDFNTINQSVIWTAPSGVSSPDIVGVRGAVTHRFGFLFRNSTSDSLKYLSVYSDGTIGSLSGRMNSVNLTTGFFGPAVGMRFASGDSCFALYSASGQANLYSAQGCSGLVTIIGGEETPAEFELKQNYPNPFNPSTTISFAMPRQGFVSLKVYDILGRETAVLVNEMKNAGNYSIDFNAGNLANGVYFYRIESAEFSSVRKMILLK